MGHDDVQLQFSIQLAPPPDAEDGWAPIWEPISDILPGGPQHVQELYDLPPDGGFFRVIEFDYDP